MKYRVKLYDMQDRERFFQFDPEKVDRIMDRADRFTRNRWFALFLGILTFVFVILPVFGG